MNRTLSKLIFVERLGGVETAAITGREQPARDALATCHRAALNNRAGALPAWDCRYPSACSPDTLT